MPTTVYHNSMGYKTVVTSDRYGNERIYRFRPDRDGVGVEPHPNDDGRDYTPVVLKALWNEGIPVDWSPDDFSADERAQLDGFCDDCGAAIREQQAGMNEFERWCPQCEHQASPLLVEA
jgi:hypothetical protein